MKLKATKALCTTLSYRFKKFVGDIQEDSQGRLEIYGKKVFTKESIEIIKENLFFLSKFLLLRYLYYCLE